MCNKYPTVPLILRQVSQGAGPRDKVWIVILRDVNAVVFVSNDKKEAGRVKAAYERIGLTYDDPIDFWEQTVGTVVEKAEERLDIQFRVHMTHVGDMSQAEIAKLSSPTSTGWTR